MVAAVAPVSRSGLGPERVDGPTVELLAGGGGMRRLGPNDDLVPVLTAAASVGPALVIEPAVDRARLDAARLRRAGLTVAVVPGEWPAAAGGVDVVIGARVAAWAPCPGLAAIVVVDEHDESLQEERSPTWHARDVAIERARRAGIPVVLTSPCPSVVGTSAIAGGSVARPPVDAERASWPIVELVDRTRDEPWRTSLVTSPLISHLRRPDHTVVCLHNLPGRARILACRSCRSLTRCERCEAAVALADDGTLVCRRCDSRRPPVCLVCGASAFANLRPGVTRVKEELEAAAGRPVVAVTGGDVGPPPAAEIYVGTEAVLHRVPRADVVAFLDFDRELLAPRRPGSRAGDGAHRAGGAPGRAPLGRWPAARADVPPSTRRAPSRAARRSRPGGDRRAGTPAAARPAALRRARRGIGFRQRRWVDALPRPRRRRRQGRERAPRPRAELGRPGRRSSARLARHARESGSPSTRPAAERGPPDGSRIREPGRGDALVGSPASFEPALERVAAEVLVHDEHRRAAGVEPVEPRAPAARAAPPCRCGSAGWTRSRRTDVGHHRRPGGGRRRCRRRCASRWPRTAPAPAR